MEQDLNGKLHNYNFTTYSACWPYIVIVDHAYYSFFLVYFDLCSWVHALLLYQFQVQLIYEGWYSGMDTPAGPTQVRGRSQLELLHWGGHVQGVSDRNL